MTYAPSVALLLAGCLLTPPGIASGADAIPGRLFTTPEWRTAVDRQRQAAARQSLPADGIAGDQLRLDGVVVRSSGRSTVWINRQAQHDRQYTGGFVAQPSPQHPEKVAIGNVPVPGGGPGDGHPVDLKVGTTLDLGTGTARGGLANGEIRVRK